MDMYFAAKHAHLFFILLSVTLFVIQYVLKVRKSPLLEHRFFKIVPHAVNGALIISGLMMLAVTGYMPFTEGGAWLTEKLTCVLAYIALGVFTMKIAANEGLRAFAFFGALGWLIMAANVTISKTPMWF
jgi:uncharacterized membrane protein SirB2